MEDLKPSVMADLLSAAELRTAEVLIGDKNFHVRELSAGTAAAYASKLDSDKDGAIAIVLQHCVIDENGLPALTREAALKVSHSARVAMRLMAKITEISDMGKEGAEKKVDAS